MRSNISKMAALFSIASLPRLLGAFFLPNAFGDAYVYIQEIGTLSTKISNGHFRLIDLFGFWLPLYQIISALLNLFIKNGFYSGKIVAALFGAATCVLVYFITRRLTNNVAAASCVFILIVFNPLHIFYSASAMTDVPHAFFVSTALYFVLTGNWIVAAIFGAFAGFTRVESWMLIALFPFLQLTRERRVSVFAIVVLVVPPMFWFYISWRATGNWLACFAQRQQYHDWLLQMNPAIAHFSPVNVLRDGATLLISSDIAVLIAAIMAGLLVIKRMPQLLKSRANSDGTFDIVAPVLFFFAFFALLFVAYLTHQQPIIFPRYGLILFTLGLPILAWTFLLIRKRRPQIARPVIVVIITICLLDFGIQFAGAVGTVNQYRAQRAVADYLRDHFDPNSGARIFCDEGTVRALSGIPQDRFLTSVVAPTDREAFLKFLDEKNVEYLVVVEAERSRPFGIFRSAVEYDERIGNHESVMASRTDFIYTAIHVYRKIER